MLSFLYPFIALLYGYALGSIPSGYIFTKHFTGRDIRTIGSGNIGATNALRTGNKVVAILTLLGDSLKGVLVILSLKILSFSQEALLLAGAAAVLGHIFPIWLNFKGGKGVATTFGVILVTSWPLGLLILGTWIFTAVIWRYSSLAAIVASASAPIWSLLFLDTSIAIWATFLALLVLFKHTDNIKRLLAGKEPKIGASKPKSKMDKS